MRCGFGAVLSSKCQRSEEFQRGLRILRLVNQARLLVTYAKAMGVWSAFKEQSSNFPSRAFIVPNPAKHPLSIDSDRAANSAE